MVLSGMTLGCEAIIIRSDEFSPFAIGIGEYVARPEDFRTAKPYPMAALIKRWAVGTMDRTLTPFRPRHQYCM